MGGWTTPALAELLELLRRGIMEEGDARAMCARLGAIVDADDIRVHVGKADGGPRVIIVNVWNPFVDDLEVVVSRAASPFTEEERLLLELLAPHLASALATRRSLAAL